MFYGELSQNRENLLYSILLYYLFQIHLLLVKTDELRILVLAASCNEAEIVNKCKKKGVKTIVTDFYLDHRRSPAKDIADEYWDESWNDINKLEQLCVDNGINGVIAGFSEFTVDSMISLCSSLKLPCYINKEQLEVTRDKVKFKKLCERYGIPIVREYSSDSQRLVFPVIIKPTDRAGSIGISVARNIDEYNSGLSKAVEASISNKVIVEQFMGNALKFDCYYEIIDGVPYLLGTSDTIMLSNLAGNETLQKAWSYPSKVENEYKELLADKVETMITDMNFSFGYCTISFFFNNASFYAFEAGFRLSGEHSFNYQIISQGNNYLDDMIDYSLGQPLIPREHTNKENNAIKMLTYNIYIDSIEGMVIDQIDCLESIKCLNNVISTISYVYNGYVSSSSKPLKVAMCSIQGESAAEIWSVVEHIHKLIRVTTNLGIKHIINPLSHEDVLHCWSN